jgi:cytochrome c oxidase subunit 2
MPRHAIVGLWLVGAGLVTGCGGPQSALEPAGRDADAIHRLFVIAAVGGIAIWLAVVALALYAPRARARPGSRAPVAIVVGGGVVLPLVVLTALLVYGLSELPSILARAPEGQTTIEVTGAQWWWRVRYLPPGGEPIELANELWLPVGDRTGVRLVSRDVIHSFWVPPLAGKLDAIPGRVNVLALQPTETGTYRGTCAEYCGASHARMSLVVRVVERREFDGWLMGQAQPAAAASGDAAERGARAFLERGCAACHTIRGTAAFGRVGPDLTHLASRQTLAAGTLPLNADQLTRWLTSTRRLKPQAHMPPFERLSDEELTALTAYLLQLK